ncbi:hypothetical protein KUTeg_022467 [Tegillarca granosa]|uniref:kynurenine--oxoglutarate transaminase n=1 Tax=Tegillarca granosa TaxID=220873 RepID=A0ABQ9E6B6_TEGGR|nr:hypothetical protein KUTeg_022467 [Tegillarca granosa]
MTTAHGIADRLKGTEKNICLVSVEFGKLATENKALNLGQGFPDFKPPQHVIDEMVSAVTGDNHLMSQYTRSFGHPRLVDVLSNLYSPMIGHKIDPNHEVTISVGAYGVLFCTVQGLINPGDEVIIIEPFFDCYEPMTKVAGGVPRFVPLRSTKTDGPASSADFKLDKDELAKAFNSKTKAIFINNPNNPCGKVFQREELEMIAELCMKHDVLCISDEVYEWLIYEPNKHIKIAELKPKRDKLAKLLADNGMKPIVPEGGYFMLADISKFIYQMMKLAAIPPSAFYSKDHKNLGENFVRFCFIKKDETLDKAAEIFNNWNKK